MNCRYRSLTLTAFALGALVVASGCEVSKCKTDTGQNATCAESLTRFTDSDANKTMQVDYMPGMDLVIHGTKGNIHVNPGSAGVVAATFTPFVQLGHSRANDAKNMMENLLTVDVSASGNTVNVTTVADYAAGASDELGATIELALPPEFDGNLTVTNDGHGNAEESNIAVNAVGSAISATLTSYDLGDCDLDGAPSIVNTTVNCDGLIEITNVSDNVTAHSTSAFTDDQLADVRVTFAGISDTATGGTISTKNGRIELGFPLTGNYTIVANANADGVVNEGTLPTGCMVSGAGNAKQVTCGTGGASYDINAGSDDAFGANIDIGYQ